MKKSPRVSGPSLMGPVAFGLLVLTPLALGGACAASIDAGPASSATSSSAGTGTGTGGAGGDGTGGSPVVDAGPDAPPLICTVAADCAGMTDLCNVGTCINGACAKTPANEFGACNDGKYCTENDVCQKGACVGGSPKYCASLDTCHLAVCDEELKTCKNIAGNDGAQCDDMNACTVAGVCQGGTCTQGQSVDCTFFNSECSKGICTAGKGCSAEPINEGGPCNNGDANGCSQGQCKAGACTSVPKNDGQTCDDAKFCTINDHCLGGGCVGDPNPCAPPSNACMIGVCNENAKSCVVTIGNDGSPCDDGNFCTGGEKCASGQCVGGQPANNGVACDDKNGCTGGTTCINGTCGGPTSQITTCSSGDACCPAGCSLNSDADCLYWQSGVQQNVPEATLQGWSKCFTGTYADNSPTLSSLLQQCNKANLLMACRQVGQPSWKLVAMAPRADVLFDCGMQNNCTKQSNGVGWYYSDSYSWGFAPGGEAVNRNSCDYDSGLGQTSPDQRLCWHSSAQSINNGYRCGNNQLNGDSGWERAVYQAD
jgi:hypothetical protein